MTDTEYDSDFPSVRTEVPEPMRRLPTARELHWVTEHTPPALVELADDMARELYYAVQRDHRMQRLHQSIRRRMRRRAAANFVI